jgi:enoyl-CoA hydratase/carnithine racemase
MLPDARKPSVAAIDGVALGGGLEVAMVCLDFIRQIKLKPIGFF